MDITVRHATEHDLVQVRDIFAYYVANTVVSFLVQDPPLALITSRWQDSVSRKLPYFVATDQSCSKVVGYAYASAFRGTLLGYGHTVEISLFCHPEHTSRGVGSLLIAELIGALRKARHLTRETGYEKAPVEFQIKKVMAIMAVDETAPGEGLALRDWYKRWGFEEVGRLKGVGSKDGRIIDTMYLELHIE